MAYRNISLKTRFLLLIAFLFLLASVAAWMVFQKIAEGIIGQWGQRVAEIQVRYDSARLMQPLEREIALAHQMADSNILRRWAANPEDEELKIEAISEMESFRRNFRDQSYFVALQATGAYYHNNADNAYAGKQLRYHLSPERPADAWFYQLIREGRDYHLNVNPDVELGVTKLWIDVLMRDGEQILGIVGTGMALDAFLRDVVDIRQPGITTLFVDHKGAIQLYRDQDYIDYASFIKPEGQKNTVDLLLDNPADYARVEAMMAALKDNTDANGLVKSDFFMVDGKRHLLGIGYMPSIGWYEITLLDLDVLLPVSSFAPILAVFAITLLLALLALHGVLHRLILNPLALLDAAMRRVSGGDLNPVGMPSGQGEIGRLIEHFGAMAMAIRNNTRELEQKVRERTESLYRLARIDPLTELANRRGMGELLDKEADRAKRQDSSFGLLWLDLDHFKVLNDHLGHAAGDQALIVVAQQIRANIRPYDHAARWGGDEFLALLSGCDRDTLEQIGERVRLAIEQELGHAEYPVTVSVGAYLAQPGEEIEHILQCADEALYAAKAAGRNLLRVAEYI